MHSCYSFVSWFYVTGAKSDRRHRNAWCHLKLPRSSHFFTFARFIYRIFSPILSAAEAGISVAQCALWLSLKVTPLRAITWLLLWVPVEPVLPGTAQTLARLGGVKQGWNWSREGSMLRLWKDDINRSSTTDILSLFLASISFLDLLGLVPAKLLVQLWVDPFGQWKLTPWQGITREFTYPEISGTTPPSMRHVFQ